ncbi:MAG: 3'-5' exonuclease [Planctomycetia bacterium]|nr:3'-5' exonuclease [Planctomycetia bacterium]
MNFLAFDLESTGLDVTCDRIIEIAIVRDGTMAFSARINPGQPIPPEIAKLTGITDDDVRDCPSFAEVAPLVKAALEGQVVAGYGINRFDIAILCEEMLRAGVPFDFHSVTWIDVGELYKQLAPRTLSAAVKEFLDRDHTGAHGAGPDAAATAEILAMMRRRYPEKVGQATPAELAIASRYGHPLADPAGKLTYLDGQLCFNFGKSKGIPVADDIGFARWMLDRDFPLATKQVIRAEFERLNNQTDALPASVLPGQ